VVQAALKLALEPIFEADSCRLLRGSDTSGGRITPLLASTVPVRVLGADIGACFDMIDHTMLMDWIRAG
jgi:RNA-directed DNA polymerase